LFYQTNKLMDNNKKVWFITGASKGFGLSLVKQLLDAGELVAATSRNQTFLNEDGVICVFFLKKLLKWVASSKPRQ